MSSPSGYSSLHPRSAAPKLDDPPLPSDKSKVASMYRLPVMCLTLYLHCHIYPSYQFCSYSHFTDEKAGVLAVHPSSQKSYIRARTGTQLLTPQLTSLTLSLLLQGLSKTDSSFLQFLSPLQINL